MNIKSCGVLWLCIFLVACSGPKPDASTAAGSSDNAGNMDSAVATEDSSSDAVADGSDSADIEADSDAVASDDEGPLVTLIEPGPNVQREAQEALILAEPGEIIEFAEGKFDFTGTLSLDGIENVTIRGQGMDKTILSFAGQKAGTGGEGLKITADKITVEHLTIEDTPSDALKVENADGVTLRHVRTWWTQGPSSENGAYGIYPVLCSDVLVEDCVAECASDAGIYVGQSRRAILRRNRAERNVAGIEIENTVGADVYENESTGNTGGLLVFSLPGLKVKNGRQCRVYDNRIYENNHPNFADPGAIVSTVPPGTGLMIMANDQVEVFNNEIRGHITHNCAVISYLLTGKRFDDAQYDAYPESIHIHDNKFADGGTDPKGEIGQMYSQLVGQRMPDIVIDGFVDESKFSDGQLPDNLRICITNNGDITFANLDAVNLLQNKPPNFSNDLQPHAGSHEPLPAISIPGVN
ncbi:MAG: right-handed parallel beta-helix repeat-containing protein [Planctomycetales bacterium]|nr:right-handed parallel beta-helix repeat-containing protein [Planctomycetales bacterium]